MLIKINKDDFKCKFCLTTAVTFFIAGLILFFIKTPLGILFLLISGGFNLYLNKKYPDFIKSIVDKQQKTHAGAWVKRFNIVHIQGVKFADYQQKLSCVISNDYIVFSDSDKELLKIEFDKIENVMVLEEIEQTQKNKSVIARAIVGGLLLGGVGAIVGGISGATPTLQSNKKYFLEISIPENEKIILTTDNNSIKEIKKTITK
ncbi:MAG: hypothetical protein NC311_11355 [Muribaculaceae bacterium]|nr:hypothetical protein [Muribaculaceae bacterium]